MSEVTYVTINAEDQGQRLDNYLFKTLKGVPKSHVYRIIRSGEVRINKKRAKANVKLMEGDHIRLPPVRTATPPQIFVGDTLAKQLHECIIFEDSHLMVINKPAGIAVHGGSGLSLGVIEAIRKIRPELPYLELVHRLDKDTSGCLLLAKKRSMLRAIHALLESRQVKKTYWALLGGSWQGPKRCQVDKALEKNIIVKSGERKVSISDEGKASVTDFRLLENFVEACLVEACPKTGRTHQIRVHSAHLGHAIVGDEKYGGIKQLTGISTRLYLHARAIQFTLEDRVYQFEAALDESFSHSLLHLRVRSQHRDVIE